MRRIPILIGIGLGLTLSLNAYASDTSIKVTPGIGASYEVTQKEYEKSLHELAKTAEKEDVYLKIKNKLHDIGYNEKKRKADVNLEKLVTLLKENQPEEASFTHIHPTKCKFEDVNQDVYPPSPGDMELLVDIKNELREKQISTKLTSKVYDGHGIWEYDITKELETQLKVRIENDFGKIFRPGAMLLHMQMGTAIEKILQNPNLTRQEKIMIYIEAVKKFGVLLKYTPIEI